VKSAGSIRKRTSDRRAKRRETSVNMVVVPTSRPDVDVIGLQAVPHRMEQVLRFPGERLHALTHRALQGVKGAGVVLVYPLLRPLDK
jgi:hypothetical protein